MMDVIRTTALVLSLFALPACTAAQSTTTVSMDEYGVILRSRSLADQREALQAIVADPQKYVPRIQHDLREYPRLLKTNYRAAERVVYIAALLRDPSFPPILVRSLGDELVLDDCIYACPAVFSLAVQSHFGGWKLPANLDSNLDTVQALKTAVAYLSRINLRVGSLEDEIQGPGVERHLKEVKGRTEEELIRLAGPTTASHETRMFAADQLAATVSTSKNRIELYLIALNDFEDGSGEYKSSIYRAIYRAELARSRGKQG
jgi:hypothetical protein